MVELTEEFGSVDGDRAVLDRDTAARLVSELQLKLRVAKKILDKGGVVIIERDDTVVTTFNRREVK